MIAGVSGKLHGALVLRAWGYRGQAARLVRGPGRHHQRRASRQSARASFGSREPGVVRHGRLVGRLVHVVRIRVEL